MRTLRPIVLSAICFIPSLGVASDVGYQLNNGAFETIEEPKANDPIAIAITDREWAAPGVEQSLQYLQPPRPFSLAGPKRLRLEYLPSERHPVTRTDFVADPPSWLDDAVWPLTRELWTRIDITPIPSTQPTDVPPLPRRRFDGIKLATGVDDTNEPEVVYFDRIAIVR